MDLNYYTFGNTSIGIYTKGPVGVFLSGGADSAILLYILMKFGANKIIIYNLLHDRREHLWKEPMQKTVEICRQLTGFKNYDVKVIQSINGSMRIYEINQYFQQQVKEGIVDIVYTGISAFPPNDVIVNWPTLPKWLYESRKPNQDKSPWGMEFSQSEMHKRNVSPLALTWDKTIYNPFINKDKKDIASIYFDQNLVETLFPVTRSCENDSLSGIQHCGNCWWCKEREWAFGRLS